MTTHNPIQSVVWMLSFILAPFFLIVSSLFWVNGLVTKESGVLLVLSFLFWIFVFQALFSLLEETMPSYAVIGFCIAVFSCLGGNNFGLDGIYTDAMGIDTQSEAHALHQRIGGLTAVYLFIPGLLFPGSLLVLGINLVRTKTLPSWTGLMLGLGAVGFPLSRIPRIAWLAHLDNGILLLALLLIATRIFKAKTPARRAKIRTSA